jgi:hypothetical protein
MKKLISIIIILTCLTFQLPGVECIQIQKENGSSEYMRIEGVAGSVSNVREFHLGAPEEDEARKMYSGYKISYLKHDGKLTLEVISNEFEGFLEIETGKYSPIITADQKKIEAIAMNSDWIEIPLKGSAPIKLKWVDVENPEPL